MKAWGKVEHARALNRKLRRAGLAARGLDEAMILWSCLEGTDGVVTIDDVEMVAMVHGCTQGVDDLVEILVEVGRWEVIEGGFLLHDWSEFHQTASKRAELARARAQAGALGGAAAQARARARQNGATAQAKAPNRANLESVGRPSDSPTAQASALASAQAEEIRRELLLSSTSDSHREPSPAPETVAPPGYPLVGRGLDDVLGQFAPDDPH